MDIFAGSVKQRRDQRRLKQLQQNLPAVCLHFALRLIYPPSTPPPHPTPRSSAKNKALSQVTEKQFSIIRNQDQPNFLSRKTNSLSRKPENLFLIDKCTCSNYCQVLCWNVCHIALIPIIWHKLKLSSSQSPIHRRGEWSWRVWNEIGTKFHLRFVITLILKRVMFSLLGDNWLFLSRAGAICLQVGADSRATPPQSLGAGASACTTCISGKYNGWTGCVL